MTEEIINALSQIKGLKVTARTSSFIFKNQKQDIRKIGKELGVSLVLEGSVRKSGDLIRVTAQLIRTDSGFHIWSEKFDRKLIGIFELQDEISLLIADKIREHFGHLEIQDRLFHVSTDNIDAYQLYLKGRYCYYKWDMPNFSRAAEYYQRSIEEDPGFDLPYYGAGLSYSFLGSWGPMEREEAFRIAEDYFDRGNRLNIPSAYTYFSVAKHQFWGHWRYKQAHLTLEKAYARQPEDANINEFKAELYTLIGDFGAALEHIEKSIQVDPLAANHFYTKANIFFLQGLWEEALRAVREGLSIHSDFAILIELRLAIQILSGQQPAAHDPFFEHIPLLSELHALMLKLVHGHDGGDQPVIEGLIGKIQEVNPPLLLAWDLYLLIHSGDHEEAIHLLEKKASLKMGQVINLKHDPFMDPLRGYKTFRQIVERYFPDSELNPVQVKPQPVTELLSEEEANQFTKRILSKMSKEKYFLRADLTLKGLAEKVELHPNKLSWLLNKRLGKNFYEFVNSYRLEEFQQRATDPQSNQLSILGIAYDSGFSSKSVFNDYFKKTTGTTPKDWVNKHRKS